MYTHTVLYGQFTDMKVGGDEWLVSVEWRGRRELNELSLFWGLCMRIHCYIFSPWPAEKKKIWVSLWLLFLVSSLDSDLSSKARAQRRSAIHNKYRQAD